MSILKNQKGSTAIVIVMGVLVLGVAGFAGYRVMQSTTPEATSDNPIVQTSKAPSTLNNSADVKKTADSLDQITIDSSVNPNQFDDDISSLL